MRGWLKQAEGAACRDSVDVHRQRSFRVLGWAGIIVSRVKDRGYSRENNLCCQITQNSVARVTRGGCAATRLDGGYRRG